MATTPEDAYAWEYPMLEDQPTKSRKPNNLFVTEISGSSFRLMGQLLHIYLTNYPNNKNALLALDELVLQTSVVHRGATKHGVFPNPFEAPKKATKFEPVYFIPIV